ncbi:MAG TPA: hypothetical protein VGV15_08590 [Terriglobales bacterium]|nr:hypothetical protein [Terriglobales bacterium]
MTPSAPNDLVQYRAQFEVQSGVAANLPIILEISARVQIAQRRTLLAKCAGCPKMMPGSTPAFIVGCEEQRIEDLMGAYRAQRRVSKRMPISSWLPALSTVLRLRFWATE